MRILIYISGIAGVMLAITGFISELSGTGPSALLWITGIALLLAFTLPLILYSRVLEQRKIDEIIRNHRENPKKEGSEDRKSEQEKTAGWGMNNSPFRKRKSGLNWGGGNIHAANASRGTRKGFLK